MGRKKNTNKILLEDLDIWYKTHNFIFEKNELYYDFFISLFDLIQDTYLGQEVLNKQDVISEHFKWCFNKVVKNFELENIYFKNNGSLYDYLWLFFSDSYYKTPTKKNIENIYEYFNDIFDFTKNKNKNELETYKFLYRLFEINFII